MGGKENKDRFRELLADEDIEKIEESHREAHMATIIEVDEEFGNILIKVGNKAPKTSREGTALVTIGIDENGEVAYISIEPEDEELAKFIGSIKKAL
jgi:uncharacterized protein YuzE